MNIHITRDGQKYGPYGLEETRDLLQAGQLLASDLAWHDGLEEWTTLGELLAVSGDTPPPVLADGVSESLKAKTSKSALVLRIVLVVILVAVGSVVGLVFLGGMWLHVDGEYVGPGIAGEYIGPGGPGGPGAPGAPGGLGGPGGPGPVPFGGSEESSTEYDDNWMTDLPAAIQLAKKENKHVFVDFTGSDWCPPCKALHRNVLTKQAFLDYAKNNLVLVVLDFPRRRPQPDSLKRANQALSQKYRVEGFPTVMLMDSNGKILHRESGYSGNSAAAYVANLKTKVSQ